MSILSGYGKFKRYVLTDSGYRLCSQWTSSNTVHFDDGNTAQTKVGAINGITDSLTATNSNIALSAAAGRNLQNQVTQLNTGFANVGTLINAQTINLSVPHTVNTIVSKITLPPGKWMIIANMWVPVDNGAVALDISGIAGVVGIMTHPQVIGYVVISKYTEYNITCSQWSGSTVTIVDPHVIGIRIA